MSRPDAGDFVEFYEQHKAYGRGSHRVGRVKERIGDRELSVWRPCKRPTCDGVCHHRTDWRGKPRKRVRVPLEDVIGWWPAGSSARHAGTRREAPA